MVVLLGIMEVDEREEGTSGNNEGLFRRKENELEVEVQGAMSA